MDNGGCHRSKIVQDMIKSTKNQLQYIVPYKPKTNAIESWFNQFKHYYKLNETSISFDEVKQKIKKKNYINYMNYAYKKKEVRKITIKKSTKRMNIKQYKI
mgnify:CR=1 FL=1